MLTFEFPDLIQWVHSDPVTKAFTNVELKRSKYEKPKFFDLWKNFDFIGNKDARKKLVYDCLSVGIGLGFFGLFLSRSFKDA